jgi:hypothetical protein
VLRDGAVFVQEESGLRRASPPQNRRVKKMASKNRKGQTSDLIEIYRDSLGKGFKVR